MKVSTPKSSMRLFASSLTTEQMVWRRKGQMGPTRVDSHSRSMKLESGARPSSARTLNVVTLMSLRASLGNSMEGYMLEVLNLMLYFIFLYALLLSPKLADWERYLNCFANTRMLRFKGTF